MLDCVPEKMIGIAREQAPQRAQTGPSGFSRARAGTFLLLLGFGQELVPEAVMTTHANVRRVAADADGPGIKALEGVREVRDNLAKAIDKSLNTRPYTTLMLAVGLGFFFGAIWTL
jgi:hypothetical protein